MNVNFSSAGAHKPSIANHDSKCVNAQKYQEIEAYYAGALVDLINNADDKNMPEAEYYRKLNALRDARDEAIFKLDIVG